MATNKIRTKQNTVICQKYWKILPYTTINLTVISVLQLSVKSIGKCKKKSLHNQPKQYFLSKDL
jgi:hypothetical protein